jgi:hypothetical protein
VSTAARAEVEHAVTALDVSAPAISLNRAPTTSGLYSLAAKSIETVRRLGLADMPGEKSLRRRILYLGKAEDSLLSRLAATHFATGETGRSTIRRTLAALLELSPIPRKSGVREPSRRQLMTMSANYSLVESDDLRLTHWMEESLEVRAIEVHREPLKDFERAVGAVLKPPLDQERPPMWTPNPWRIQVGAARGRMRSIVRSEIGLDD